MVEQPQLHSGGSGVAAATIEAKALMRADMAAFYVATASDWRAK